MKKIVTIATTITLTAALSAAAFATTVYSPAEILANLTGKTTTQVYELREDGKTFGQIADENGVYESFKNDMLENKKAIIDQRVQEGSLTAEQGEAFKKAFEEKMATCDGSSVASRERLGQKFGGGFGKGQGRMGGMGMGQGSMMRQGI